MLFIGILLDYWLGHVHEIEILPREKILVGLDKSVMISAGRHDDCSTDVTPKSYNTCIKDEILTTLNATCSFAPWNYWPELKKESKPVCSDYKQARKIRKRLRKMKTVEKR